MIILNNGVALFHSYVRNKFIRFLFVGGLNTIFGYSIYCLMILLGLSYIWATVIQQVLGVLFNFITTGALVFENSDNRLLLKFITNYMITYFISVGVNKGLQEWYDLDTYISGMGGTFVAAMASFVLLKYFVYKDVQRIGNRVNY